MKTFDRGTAIYITAALTDKTGAAFDPTSVVISVLDPAGAAKLTDQAMTRLSTGAYEFVFQSSEADATGNYTVKIKALSGAYTSINRMKLFTLE